jgi:aquaporin Z
MKKYFAEFIGTFVLVLFGCGTAVLSGGINGVVGIIGISFAFGLSIVAMAYFIGGISGCHINPAVSFSMFLCKKINIRDFIGYVIAQFAGAIAGIAILVAIINTAGVNAGGLGQNGFGEASYIGISMWGAFWTEVILTFVFITTILGVTSNKKMGSVGGIVIGLTLTFVHLFGIPLTGTSVNPARSLAPAIFAGGLALQQVWVFIVAPLVGAIFAAIIHKGLIGHTDN